MARTPFKLKSSPTKGKLQDFFNTIGSQLKAGQKDRGIFSEKGKAEKKSREAGESKFQADVRRRRVTSKDRPTASLDTKINNNFTKNVLSPSAGTDRVNKTLDLKKTKKWTLRSIKNSKT